MRRLHSLSIVAFLSAIVPAALQAGPIPAPPLGPPVLGESLLTSFVVGPANSINIDWWVIPTAGTPFPAGNFAYLYQIENTSGVGLDAFSITLSLGQASQIVSAGVLGGDDLDLATAFHPAHTIVGEADPFPLSPLSSVLTTIDTGDDSITWTFSPLLGGRESDTLFFISPQPPMYGNAVAQDSIPPSPWGTLAVSAQQIPIPIPEPSSMTLAGIVLAGAVSLRLWKKRR